MLDAILILGAYGYVGVAMYKAERRTGAGCCLAIGKAISWPVTIWHTIKKVRSE